jgi:hemerythrin-like domain-containing protein
MLMAVQLGSKGQADFSQPIELMVDCHRRIEHFLGVLERVLEQCPGGLDDTARRALDASLRYFREAAPRHSEDEEESLLPRLRGLGRAELREVLASAERVEREHRRAERLHERVEACGRVWLEGGELDKARRDAMRADLGALRELYVGHIEFEEERLFPAAAGALDEGALASMGREMAARRRVGARG